MFEKRKRKKKRKKKKKVHGTVPWRGKLGLWTLIVSDNSLL
jgi:hypothetical protein